MKKINSIKRTYSERLKYFRRKNGMTQMQLGMALGNPEGSADVRIAQYETGGRSPGQETADEIAAVFHVDSRALTVPDMSLEDTLHYLFALEDRHGIKPYMSRDRSFVGLDLSECDTGLRERIEEWCSVMRFLEDKSYGSVIYDAYRYCYPYNSRYRQPNQNYIEIIEKLSAPSGADRSGSPERSTSRKR